MPSSSQFHLQEVFSSEMNSVHTASVSGKFRFRFAILVMASSPFSTNFLDYLGTLKEYFTVRISCSPTIGRNRFNFDLATNSTDTKRGEENGRSRHDSGFENVWHAFKMTSPPRNVTKLWKRDVLGLLFTVYANLTRVSGCAESFQGN